MGWGSVLGAGLAGGLGIIGASEANKTNARIASAQMDFQSSMSNTAYQRSVADMRAAGLNPILSYQQGGASSPPGASSLALNEMDGVASSAMQARRLETELENLALQNDSIRSTIDLNKALETKSKEEISQIKSSVTLNQAHALKALEDAKLSGSSAKFAEANKRYVDAQKNMLDLKIPAESNKSEFEKTAFGKAANFFNSLFGGSGATNALSLVKKNR